MTNRSTLTGKARISHINDLRPGLARRIESLADLVVRAHPPLGLANGVLVICAAGIKRNSYLVTISAKSSFPSGTSDRKPGATASLRDDACSSSRANLQLGHKHLN